MRFIFRTALFSCFMGEDMLKLTKRSAFWEEQPMENKKLILFDIDGTLFDNKNGVIPPKSLEAITKIDERHSIGIATGRAAFMLYSIDQLKPLIDDYVLINGQYITSKDQVVFKNPIPTSSVERLVSDIASMDFAYGFENSHAEAISKINDKVIYSFQKLGLKLPPIDPLFYQSHDIYQIWVFAEPSEANRLRRQYPEFQFIRWMEVGYDILPKDCSKGLGMKRLAEYLKIDLADVIAFGDGDNDYEMVRDAGLGIAMGNATAKVKAVAKYVTADVSDNGIQKALKHFNLIK